MVAEKRGPSMNTERMFPLSLLVLLAGCDNEGGVTKVYDTPPAVAIQLPPSGTEVNEGEALEFQALVTDDVDDPPALDLLWSSDIDGVLSEESSADADGYVFFTTSALSPGNHVITLQVTDSGAQSAEDWVDIVVLSVPDAPTVEIIHPIPGEYGIEGEEFEFVALVEDAADEPEALLLSIASDLDGVFCEPTPDGVGKAACSHALSAGGHVLTFTVTDSDGMTATDLAYFEVTGLEETDGDGDGFTDEMGDCDDDDDSIYPTADESANGEDDDCDGTIDEGTAAYDDDGDGMTELEGDCDDDDDDVYVGAGEVCDGIDNDCDGDVDEGTSCLDDDGDGFTELMGDCDDTSSATYPGATEIPDGEDNDCDGYADEGTIAYDDDGDCFCEDDDCTGSVEDTCGEVLGGDCDDEDEEINPDALEVCDGVDNDCDDVEDEPDASDAGVWYADGDDDGYGGADDSTVACEAPDGFVGNATDCDDGAPGVNPAATETCNEVDDDCDDLVDEGVETTYYRDSDGDGYGNPLSTESACSLPSGFVSNDDDCDDGRAASYPGATERCNDYDDDCDGSTDESSAVDASTWYLDADSDSYGNSTYTSTACDAPTGYTATAGDCNDGSSSINPSATEKCNSVDDDCDGTTDESSASDASTWYLDGDGDGYGVSTSTTVSCSKPSGYASVSTDCNDGSSAVNPAATETCNSTDDDCDGSTDEGVTTTYYKDADGDGYGTSSTSTSSCSKPTGYVTNAEDCDDGNASLNPTTVWYIDYDGDSYGTTTATKTQCAQPTGYVSNSSDCNDLSTSAYPGRTEACDSIDNDCDSSTDEAGASGCTTWYYDYDGDGYGSSSVSGSCLCSKSGYYTSSVATDCYDYSTAANPAATTWYSTNRGDGSYDYNCDGSQSTYYSSTYSCGSWPGCSDGLGWRSSVPSCGATGSYVTNCYLDWFSCSVDTSTYTQYCR